MKRWSVKNDRSSNVVFVKKTDSINAIGNFFAGEKFERWGILLHIEYDIFTQMSKYSIQSGVSSSVLYSAIRVVLLSAFLLYIYRMWFWIFLSISMYPHC